MRLAHIAPIVLLLGCSNSPPPVPPDWWTPQSNNQPNQYDFDCDVARQNLRTDPDKIAEEERRIEELEQDMQQKNLQKEDAERRREGFRKKKNYEGVVAALGGLIASLEEAIELDQRGIKTSQGVIGILKRSDERYRAGIPKYCH